MLAKNPAANKSPLAAEAHSHRISPGSSKADCRNRREVRSVSVYSPGSITFGKTSGQANFPRTMQLSVRFMW
ncbi:MAG TPA: hypothetical protein VJ302_32280 [Blastocatellia bacterium]|nr:hypothetical protein [Blastocatellia bacterium]